MTRRVLSAEIGHETNTFSILPTTLESYRTRIYFEGADIARAISREVVLETLMPRDRPAKEVPPAQTDDPPAEISTTASPEN